MAQSTCRPDDGIAVWASKTGQSALAVKARYGWSECLLVCDCGEFVKLELTGSSKPL